MPEWVRDEVLKLDVERFNHYFPPGKWRPPEVKWREVPKELTKDHLIDGSPDWGQGKVHETWEQWLGLLKYRHGLVHAGSSRPEIEAQPARGQPSPSVVDFGQLAAGWATGVVTALVRHLHEAAGSPAPEWLVDV